MNEQRQNILSGIADAFGKGDKQAVTNLKTQLAELGKNESAYYNKFLNSEIPSEGSTVYPLMIRDEGFLPVDAQGANWRNVNQAAVDAAGQANAPGVIIRNVEDNAGAYRGTSDVYATPDPSRIRSRFAAFDPARVNENDLLGAADPRFLGALAAGSAVAAPEVYEQIKRRSQK